MTSPTTTTRSTPAPVAHARSRLPSADDAARLTGLLSLPADPVRLR